ncbi:MAG TPA: substrate-binding domain-containing protein, partial [Gemmatimonadaceae bacterium]|nr:substrate-binding domain-containing protein [Gemmatimonadaceae bacterium]
ERLATKTGVIVAGHQLGLAESVTLDELADVPWVLNHEGCVFRNALKDAFAAQRRTLQYGVEVAGAELQLSLIARGHGVGMVLPHMLERSAFRDAVRVLDVTDFKPTFAVWLVHSAHPGRLAAPIKCFRDALALQVS